MGYPIIFNCLLTVSSTDLDLSTLKVGEHFSLVKNGERPYPLNIPIEICDENHRYFGKVAVRKLTLEAGKTTLEVEALKIFDDNEAEVYTRAFIKL
ncbi:MAG TPA: DUF2584 family protein [Candidatus Saccharimonadales bacterium]|nr:DUF2584 family protein [Candidatus Saccharimonadales bacterium]